LSSMEIPKTNFRLIYLLMVPLMMDVVNVSMFLVTLPSVRNEFSLEADLVSWVVIAYTLPYTILMPLYGRLGDSLGKRRLLLLGITIFTAGSLTSFISMNLPVLIIGRIVQGVGGASVNPLSLAIILETAPVKERGKLMGTWQSVGPIAFMAGPFVAGFMVDHFGWRTIFVPIFVMGLISFFTIVKGMADDEPPKAKGGNSWSQYLRTFDWPGVVLLSSAVLLFIGYISSRPITGISTLLDWRLLLLFLLAFIGFIVRERRSNRPFVSLSVFRIPSFPQASILAALRMLAVSAMSFLIPLYLADTRGLNASLIGIIVMLQSVTFLATMRLGGRLADVWTSRWPVIFGFFVQGAGLAIVAFLPEGASLAWIVGGLLINGLGSGVTIAALHQAALSRISADHTGMAAGLYSMIRFGGRMIGAVLGGVLLQTALGGGLTTLSAYNAVLWSIVGMSLLSSLFGWGLKRQ
jgi:MFS family permease